MSIGLIRTERELLLHFAREACKGGLTNAERKALFEDVCRRLPALEPEAMTDQFERILCAALSGICASHSSKFDCQNKVEIARAAVSIARHVMDELSGHN